MDGVVYSLSPKGFGLIETKSGLVFATRESIHGLELKQRDRVVVSDLRPGVFGPTASRVLPSSKEPLDYCI